MSVSVAALVPLSVLQALFPRLTASALSTLTLVSTAELAQEFAP